MFHASYGRAGRRFPMRRRNDGPRPFSSRPSISPVIRPRTHPALDRQSRISPSLPMSVGGGNAAKLTGIGRRLATNGGRRRRWRLARRPSARCSRTSPPSPPSAHPHTCDASSSVDRYAGPHRGGNHPSCGSSASTQHSVLVLDTQGELSVAMSTRISILLTLIAACDFPRPPDVMPPDGMTEPPDASPNACSGDLDCSGTTPVCIDQVCAVCRASTSCPASAPVCDDISHDCRMCAKDSECASGACDLAAGTCVDRTAILYVSPGGAAADPCTTTSPCSLRRAVQLVGTDHLYIAMSPGSYTGGADFDGKTATIVGNGATIDCASDASFIHIIRSSITIRDLQVVNSFIPGQDALGVIETEASNLTIDGLRASTHHIPSVYSHMGDNVVIRHSIIKDDYSLYVTGSLLVDDCQFLTAGPVVTGEADISNSILLQGLYILGDAAHPRSEMSNNTFIGAGVICATTSDTTAVTYFTNNIFYNPDSFSVASGCRYNYNLFVPNRNIDGIGNTTGEPMFVDIAGQDFHLKAGSPAIDAADPAGPTSSDYDGISRPQGIRSDIGAFEYVPR